MQTRYERDDARRRVVVTMEGPFVMMDYLSGMTGEPNIADLRQSLIHAALAHRLRGPIAALLLLTFA